MSSSISRSKFTSPSGQTRNRENPPAFMIPFFKMPLILYRLGLGWMLGKRFLLLTHVGRHSGKVYQSVLAVLRFDEKTHEILAVSPWSKSNWHQNIQIKPALKVETGFIRYTPMQRNLSPEEIAALFIEFRKQRPIFSRVIARIPGWKINSTYDEFLALAYTLRGVAFQPKNLDEDGALRN
jgi:deazaflavin-dependent oxidoreductase (nitroreductase family)